MLVLFSTFLVTQTGWALDPTNTTSGVMPDTGFAGAGLTTTSSTAVSNGIESITISNILRQIFTVFRNRVLQKLAEIGSHTTNELDGSVQDLVQLQAFDYNDVGQLNNQRGRVDGTFSSNGGLTHGEIHGTQTYEIGAGGLAMLDKSLNLQDSTDELNMQHTVSINTEDRANNRATGQIDAVATTGTGRTYTTNLNLEDTNRDGKVDDLVDGSEVSSYATTTNHYINILGDVQVDLSTTNATTYDNVAETISKTVQQQGTTWDPATGRILSGRQTFDSLQTAMFDNSCTSNCEHYDAAGHLIGTDRLEVTISSGATDLGLTYSGQLVALHQHVESTSLENNPLEFDPSQTLDPNDPTNHIQNSVSRSRSTQDQVFNYVTLADGTLTGKLDSASGLVGTFIDVLTTDTVNGIRNIIVSTDNPLTTTIQNTTIGFVVANNSAVSNGSETSIVSRDFRGPNSAQAYTEGHSSTLINVDMTTGGILGGSRVDAFTSGNAASTGVDQWALNRTDTRSETTLKSIGNQAVDNVTTNTSVSITFRAVGGTPTTDISSISLQGQTTTARYVANKGVAQLDRRGPEVSGFTGATVTFSGTQPVQEGAIHTIGQIFSMCQSGGCVKGPDETELQYATRIFGLP